MSAEIDRLRTELRQALTDYRRARTGGYDLLADGAAKRIQTCAAALTALALTEPHTSFDEHAADAVRHTMRSTA